MTNTRISLEKVKDIHRSGNANRATEFQVHRYSNTHIDLFPVTREIFYREFRSAYKSEYKSAEEFLVSSINQEEFPKEANIRISWEDIQAENCNKSSLENIYAELQQKKAALPNISDVESYFLVRTNSDFNWLFLENSDKYYSVFWRKVENRLFKRYA